MKRVSVLGLSISLILLLSVFGFGCKKAEQAKEEAKPAAKVEAPAKGVTVVEFTFEKGKQSWFNRAKIKMSQDKARKHEGQASLKIEGTASAGLWNFAGSQKFDLPSGKRLRFTGWMLVDSFSSKAPDALLQFNVGIYTKGKWLKNAPTPPYVMAKKGEWQMLSVEVEAPSEADLICSITVDKRPMDKDVTATIYVDDLVLEKMN